MAESSNLHSTAVVHPSTQLHPSITVGPYAVIEEGVEIGRNTIIGPHAVLCSGTILGDNCQVHSHAVVGGLPQDLNFKPTTPSGVRIGAGVRIREGVTISRATQEGTWTEIGENVYLMANAHVAHDCVLAPQVILANGVLLGGWVQIGEASFVGGNAAIHQFCRIGAVAMVGGLGRVSADVPPFCMMAERNRMVGLNLIGLKRRGWSRETIKEIKKAWHCVYDEEGNRRNFAEAALASQAFQDPRALEFLEFFTQGKKGFSQPEGGKIE